MMFLRPEIIFDDLQGIDAKKIINHNSIMSQRDEIIQRYRFQTYQSEHSCTVETSFNYDNHTSEDLSECPVRKNKNIVFDEEVLQGIDLPVNLVKHQSRNIVHIVPNIHAHQGAKTTTTVEGYSREKPVLLNQIRNKSYPNLASSNSGTLSFCLHNCKYISSRNHACAKVMGIVKSLPFVIGSLPVLTILLNVLVVEAFYANPMPALSSRGFLSPCPSTMPLTGKLYVRHPRICSAFYVCHKNHFWRLSCDTKNTVFSINHKDCVWEGSSRDDCHKTQNMSLNRSLPGQKSLGEAKPFHLANVKKEQKKRGQRLKRFVDKIPSNALPSISGKISQTQNGEIFSNIDEIFNRLKFLRSKDFLMKTRIDQSTQNLKYISMATATPINGFTKKGNQTGRSVMSGMRQIKNKVHTVRNIKEFEKISKIRIPGAHQRNDREKFWQKRFVPQETDLGIGRTGQSEDYTDKRTNEHKVDFVRTLPAPLPMEILWPPTSLKPSDISPEKVGADTQKTHKRNFKREASTKRFNSHKYVSDLEENKYLSSAASSEREDETGLWWIHPKNSSFREEKVGIKLDYTDSQQMGQNITSLGRSNTLLGSRQRNDLENFWQKHFGPRETDPSKGRVGQSEDNTEKRTDENKLDFISTISAPLSKSVEIIWQQTSLGPGDISPEIVDVDTQKTQKRNFKGEVSIKRINSYSHVSDQEDNIYVSSEARSDREDKIGLWWIHPKKLSFQKKGIEIKSDHTDSQQKGRDTASLERPNTSQGRQKRLSLAKELFSHRKQTFDSIKPQVSNDVGRTFFGTEQYKNGRHSGKENLLLLSMNDSFESIPHSTKESHVDAQDIFTQFVQNRQRPVPYLQSRVPLHHHKNRDTRNTLDASHNQRLLDQFLDSLGITTTTANMYPYQKEIHKVIRNTDRVGSHLNTIKSPESKIKQKLKFPNFGNRKTDVPQQNDIRKSKNLRKNILDIPWFISSIDQQKFADIPSDRRLQYSYYVRKNNKFYDHQLPDEIPKSPSHQTDIKVKQLIPEYPIKSYLPRQNHPFEIKQQELQKSEQKYDINRFPSWLQGLNRNLISRQNTTFTVHNQLYGTLRRERPLFQNPNILFHEKPHKSFQHGKLKHDIPGRLKTENDRYEKPTKTQISWSTRSMRFPTTKKPLQSLNLSKRPWYLKEDKRDHHRRKKQFGYKKQRSKQPISKKKESYMDRYIRWKEQLREQEEKRRNKRRHVRRNQHQSRNRNQSKQFQDNKLPVSMTSPPPAERIRLERTQNKKRSKKWYDHLQNRQQRRRKNEHKKSDERSLDSTRSRSEKRNRQELILNQENKPNLYRYPNQQNRDSRDLKLNSWERLQFPKWKNIRDQRHPPRRQCSHKRKHNDQQSVITPIRKVYTTATPVMLNLTYDPTTVTSQPSKWLTVTDAFVSTGTVTERTIRLPPSPQSTESQDGRRSHNKKGLDDRCGIMARPFIIGGRRSRPGQWPWQASLQIVTSTTPWHRCGAVLVHERWVLTAAHCMEGPFYGDIRNWRVVMADYDLEVESGHEIYRQVVRIVSHPGYVRVSNFPNDVALLELDRPVDVTSGEVQTACLPDETMSLTAGAQCWISGWGETRGSGGRENAMNEVPVEVVSLDRCKAMWGRVDIEVLDSQICLGTGEIGACYGDSGGPLMCEQDGRFYVSGVMSWLINNCSAHNFPNVFTRLQSHMDWVVDQLNFYAGYRAI